MRRCPESPQISVRPATQAAAPILERGDGMTLLTRPSPRSAGSPATIAWRREIAGGRRAVDGVGSVLELPYVDRSPSSGAAPKESEAR